MATPCCSSTGALPAETIEHAGHFLQEDADERLAARIVRFLESHPVG
jgi:pimeloyl-ACP methyl ester carboxylesterase